MKRNLNHGISRIAFGVVLSVAMASCKRMPQSSEVASLDNFAGVNGGFHFNECGPAQASPQTPYATKVRDHALKGEVLASLEAVPDTILKLFFDTMGGQVVIDSPTTVTNCAASLSVTERRFVSESGNTLPEVCLGFDESKRFTLFVVEKKNVIRHSFVRVLSYIYSQVLTDTLAKASYATPAYTAAVHEGVNKEKKYMSVLASEFLDEARSQQAMNLTALESFSQTQPEEFARYAFAEALDSYYCSAKTKSDFQKFFPSTYQLFTDTADVQAKVDPNAQKSYALTFGIR